MPHGSSRPLPSRTVRSSPLSQVIGASSRRSSARPFAAPRTSSIVPSVMMNGTTRRPVMSTPFISPHDGAGRQPRRPRRRRATSRHEETCAITTVLERDDRAHGQIDPARHDHHRHAQRRDAHDGGLPRHELEIGGAEKLRTDEKSEEKRHEHEAPEHSGICKPVRNPRRRRLVMSACAAPDAGSDDQQNDARSTPRPAVAAPRRPRDITAIRSHRASSSGK